LNLRYTTLEIAALPLSYTPSGRGGHHRSMTAG